jgi:hypothetical protein
VGIKTAQTLNLHSLGRAASQLQKARAPGGEDDRNVRGNENGSGARGRKVVDLELGKRLWWALAQEDWFAIPFRGVWCKCSDAAYPVVSRSTRPAGADRSIAIHPDHFDTPIPNNCHDADLSDGVYINRPDTELTVAL